MSRIVLEEPLDLLEAQPGLYGINGEPMTRQDIVLVGFDEVIAILDKQNALALAQRLTMLAEQIQPDTTGWALDGHDGWRPQLRRLASVDDELRDRDA